MPECKYKIRKGRYSRDCSNVATSAITFSSELSPAHIITVQLPLCEMHYQNKAEELVALGQPFTGKTL